MDVLQNKTGVKNAAVYEDKRHILRIISDTDGLTLKRGECLCVFCAYENVVIDEATINNDARLRETENCRDKKTKEQKYTSWKALQYALKLAAPQISAKDFGKRDDGRWVHDGICVSLTHTRNAAAAAIAYASVGADAELFEPLRFDGRLAERILTEKEYAEYSDLSAEEKCKYAAAKWTAKESLFKQKGGGVFSARKIDTTCQNYATAFLPTDVGGYFVSVAANAETVYLLNVKSQKI